MESRSSVEDNPFLEQQVARTLVRDFFWSFLLAQGSSYAVQDATFLLLRDKYSALWGEEHAADITKIHKNAETIACQLKLPSKHSPLPTLGYSGEFRNVWNSFGRGLQSDRPASSFELGRLIIAKDASYMLQGRPSALVDGDLHGSIYRQHVLCAEPLKSVNLTEILAQVRQEAPALDEKVQRPTSMSSRGLQLDWEDAHPGRQFYPEDLAHLAARTQMPE